jgi:hypothetical protein
MAKNIPPSIKDSPYYNDINLLLMDGQSYSFISKWLADKGENISRQTISRYHKDHMNVDKETSIQYQEIMAQEILREGVQARMSDLDILDRIIQKMGEVNLMNIPPDKLVDLGLKAMKHKKEILDAGDEDGEISNALGLIAAAIANRGDAKDLITAGSKVSFDDKGEADT